MYPELVVDLEKIKRNAARTAQKAGALEVYGVTKGCAGSVPVAQAMLDGGVKGLADSRFNNLIELRKNFPNIPIMALRQPMREEVGLMVELDLTILISDGEAASAISRAAASINYCQKVLIMVDIGDHREGVKPAEFLAFARLLKGMPAIDLIGVAVNSGCLGGRRPSRESMDLLQQLVLSGRADGLGLKVVSPGNSSCWDMMVSGDLAKSANQVRFGEGILLGREPWSDRPISSLSQDAFLVKAEVLEVSEKKNVHQAIAAIGLQDVGSGKLIPIRPGLTVDRMTSDHCVIRSEVDLPFGSGDLVELQPSYFALQALFASTHVRTSYMGYNKKAVTGEGSSMTELESGSVLA